MSFPDFAKVELDLGPVGAGPARDAWKTPEGLTVQTLIDMGAAAVYPPGSVIADTAIDLIEKLNQRLGYAQKA